MHAALFVLSTLQKKERVSHQEIVACSRWMLSSPVTRRL